VTGQAAPFIVGLGGTVRSGSSSEKALARALAKAAALGARTEIFSGPFLAGLPIYNPHEPVPNADQARLVAAVRAADGIIVASPGYHGSISGLIKNALDCLEDLREDGRPYLDSRAVGCIVAAAGGQAAGSTLAALRAIVHALRGWPTPLGAALASPRLFDENGEFCDARDAWQVETVAEQVVEFAKRQMRATAPA
jgi:FMN reductase